MSDDYHGHDEAADIYYPEGHPGYPRGLGSLGAQSPRTRELGELRDRVQAAREEGLSGTFRDPEPLAEDSMMTQALPQRVINELAILEDRALRAEERAADYERRCKNMAEQVDAMFRETTALENALTRAGNAVKEEVERGLTRALAARAHT